MTTVVTGDRVKVTIEGKVLTEGLSGHSYCRKVQGDSGTVHYIFFESPDADVEMIQPAESFTVGQAYKSALDFTYIRTADGWIDKSGTYKDSYPQRPMVPLVAEVTVNENVLKSELRKVFRTSGDYQDRITALSVPRLVTAVKNAGVKVAG